MTTKELIDFGLFFDFISNEKLLMYFKNKSVANIPKYISGLNNLMTALDNHGYELEQKLFNCHATAPYGYCSQLSNSLTQIMQFLVLNNEEITEEDLVTLNRLLLTFSDKCLNLKILLALVEHIQANGKGKFNPVIEALEARCKTLSEAPVIVSTIKPLTASHPGCLSKKKLSIGEDSTKFCLFFYLWYLTIPFF